MGIFDKLFGRKSDKNKTQNTEQISLDDIWYSTPTISNEFPQTIPLKSTSENDTEIHEDDYRQIEFLNLTSQSLVEQELIGINAIWENQSKKNEDYTLFKKCHVRSTIGSPNLTISIDELKSILKTSNSGQVIINGQKLNNGFSIKTPYTTYFGTFINSQVTELCIANMTEESINEIKNLNKTFDLIFVNWPNCELIK